MSFLKKLFLNQIMKKKNKTIFKCYLLEETQLAYAYIQCILKEKIITNSNDSFYFREKNFKKSFTIEL